MHWILLALIAPPWVVESHPKSFVITEKPAVPQSTPEPSQIDPDFFVVVCGAEWCNGCVIYKASPMLNRVKHRFTVFEVDVDKEPLWKKHCKRLPTVWLVRRSDRKMFRSWVGAVEVDSLLTAVAAIRKEAAQKTPAVMQRTPAEHAAAKHLLDVHGINADGMTMSEMEAAHDAAHGGEGYHFPGMESL